MAVELQAVCQFQKLNVLVMREVDLRIFVRPNLGNLLLRVTDVGTDH
jgi:hypothetical protein